MTEEATKLPARRRPAKLKTAGRRLWDDVTSSYSLRPDEVAVLEQACRELDLVGQLERELDGADLLVPGSRGQQIAHPLLGEVRQHRTTLRQLLRQLKLPDGDGGGGDGGQRSTQAREAAYARWRRGGQS